MTLTQDLLFRPEHFLYQVAPAAFQSEKDAD
jgi:hypothetical protein